MRAEEWLAAARAAWNETREGASRTTLIGFSMGGAVALRLAAEAGLAPDQLILLAPHWKFADRRAVVLPVAKYMIREFKPFGRVDFDSPDMRRMLAELAPGADLDDPEVRHASQLSHHPTSALDELRRVGVSAATSASRVSAPVTIVQGLQDTTTLPAYSRELAARMGADLREIPGDHLIVDPQRPSWSAVKDAVVTLAPESDRPEAHRPERYERARIPRPGARPAPARRARARRPTSPLDGAAASRPALARLPGCGTTCGRTGPRTRAPRLWRSR